MSQNFNDDVLKLVGVRQHNLKNIDLTLQHDRFTVVSGVSGSGKSTLAFDTIYAEGGRRYIETFSPYTRQFLDRLERPEADIISGVRPAIALEQRNRISNSRSTVGTLTEINDYLKVIWSTLSSIHCPTCNRAVHADTPDRIWSTIHEQELDTADFIFIAFPLQTSGVASAESLQRTLIAEGFLRYVSPTHLKIEALEDLNDAELKNTQELFVVVDRLRLDDKDEEFRRRFLASIHQAYRFGHGKLVVGVVGKGEPIIQQFTLEFHCSGCGTLYPQPRPSLFSFNSPLGACEECRGFGHTLAIDPDICIPDHNLSINEGAVACWSSSSTSAELKKLKQYCRDHDIPLDAPWKSLSNVAQRKIFSAEKRRDGFRGIFEWFKKLEDKRYRMHVRIFIARYRSPRLCSVCHGTRLKPQALLYRINDKTLPELWKQPIISIQPFFEKLLTAHEHEEGTEAAIREVVSRLSYLNEVGLDYLTLDRQARTLSGGESQRVNLTTFLGTQLVNTMLVLDEPSIGLHQRDTERLVRIMQSLRDRGNSVLVVEHDTEIIRNADEVIDLGPQAGSKGGEIIFQGLPADLANHKTSLTGLYLRDESQKFTRHARPIERPGSITIQNATAHNLKGIDASFPLNRLVVIAGVSGSGKSSLVQQCLIETSQRLAQGLSEKQLRQREDAVVQGIQGLDQVDELIFIDQSPVGNTPRSNPATYTKAWDLIREAFAETAAAQALGLGKSAFSFNVDGGRCPVCNGAGYIRIEMQFLADVFVRCERCNGSRFQDQVLTVKLADKNVREILEMSLEDAVALFQTLDDQARAEAINARLKPLIQLGLGYLKLGQPLNHLSGGEAQRVKLASHLAERNARKCLFIFDEPTTGLHPHDITNLMSAFEQLLDRGHSVLVIEHNLFVIRHADYLIELGPEGGDGGGELVAAGPLPKLLADKTLVSRSHTLRCLTSGGSSLPSKQPKVSPKKKVAADSLPARLRPIEIVGARHHNLKNVSVTIPKDELTVIAGVSGSGKSSLAFDIIFAEGQRRYIDCLSPYARQFMTQVQRADVDRVESIPPTIAISQKTAPPMGISTIATTTEIYQYLRLLYAKVGEQRCPEHHRPIASTSPQQIAEDLIAKHSGERIFIFAPAVLGRKGYYTDLFARAVRAEIHEARIDGKVMTITPDLRLERHKIHWISLLVAQVTVSAKNRELVQSAVEQAIVLGNGAVEIAHKEKNAEAKVLSSERVCPQCQRGFLELDPLMFSFRSARGVCETCDGRGTIETKSGAMEACSECQGARISELGRNVFVGDRAIHQLTELTPPKLLLFLQKLKLPERLQPILNPILRELLYRLEMMISVGLDYLSLDRDASTLSGGEAQRLRLVRALGSPLTGVCYVLDEPTIGLHPVDHAHLLSTLNALRDEKNTVIVVEHDEETIRAADYIIDVGPGGGTHGGKIVAHGDVKTIENCVESATGRALRERSGALATPAKADRRPASESNIEIVGASTNNLRDVTAAFPLGRLTVVAGVSGAGKSSLVHGSLVPALIEELEEKPSGAKRTWRELRGANSIQRFIELDQSPIGRTPSSTPVSYLGAYDTIRKIYAMLPEAKIAGWGPSRFSFNTSGGRCEECSGRGYITIPMSFLPDATLDCEVCHGMRFNEATLEVKFQGFSIGELLKMTFDEAAELFVNHPKIRRLFNYVRQLGLGYLSLGQPSSTLSGGEAQRIRIAAELGSSEAVDTLYILDEPTTGLHMTDVDKLVSVLLELTQKGNTVILIEHNLDVIRSADHLIEVGPGPGDAGGKIIFAGPPLKLVKQRGETPTKPFLTSSHSVSKKTSRSQKSSEICPPTKSGLSTESPKQL